MPLIDRIISLGLLDAAKLAQANKGLPEEPESPKAKGDPKGDPKGAMAQSPADEEVAPTSAGGPQREATPARGDSDSDSDESSRLSSEDEDEDDRVLLNRARRSPVGRAEACRLKSRRTSRFHEIRHTVADDDAAEGFRLWGFYNGIRVYRMDAPSLKNRRRDAVRTAIGRCSMDLKSVCPPRVVEVAIPGGQTSAREVNDCFAIRPSALGGLGAFALREIRRGEHVLVERPLLRTDLFHLPRVLDRLPPAQQAEYFALHGHHPDPHACEVERIWTANTFSAGRLEAVFVLASRFNHACPPRNNVSYRYDARHDVLVMTAMQRIDAGTELLISYGKTPAMLFWRFGFRCACGACAGFSEEMATQYLDQGAW